MRRARPAHRQEVRIAVLVVVLGACGAPPRVATAPLPPIAARAPLAPRAGVPDLRCGALPREAPSRFRHLGSRLAAALGRPVHHGDDLIALADEDQRITGALGYTRVDKELEDEVVELYACGPAGWARLGTTRTDGEGRFALVLAGAQRLGAGLRDLYVRVPADGSGTAFVAFVAPARTPLVIVDVDGTLTASENAFPRSLLLPWSVAAQPDAAAALARAPAQIVYVTARGEHFTNTTHRWLADHGFPRGPVRFAPGWFARPGAAALAAKTRLLAELARRFTLADGIGNHASDVAAYTAAGISPRHIFVKLPQFARELAPLLAAHAAIGFTSYAALTFDPPGDR